MEIKFSSQKRENKNLSLSFCTDNKVVRRISHTLCSPFLGLFRLVSSDHIDEEVLFDIEMTTSAEHLRTKWVKTQLAVSLFCYRRRNQISI